MSARVFVYGTLRKGGRLHNVLQTDAVPRFGWIHGFAMLNLGYCPGIVPGDGAIRGEVYEVSAALIPCLDALESAYERLGVEVTYDDGTLGHAEVYVLRKGDGFPVVPGGDWFKLPAVGIADGRGGAR